MKRPQPIHWPSLDGQVYLGEIEGLSPDASGRERDEGDLTIVSRNVADGSLHWELSLRRGSHKRLHGEQPPPAYGVTPLVTANRSLFFASYDTVYAAHA